MLQQETTNLKEDLQELHSEFIISLETKKGTVVQQNAVQQYQEIMDEFFRTRTTAYLITLATLINQALKISINNFSEDGASYDDVKYIEESLGIKDGKIEKRVKGVQSVLFSIGALKVIENDIVSLLNSSFTGMVKLKDLNTAVQNSVSRKFHDFFEVYATGAVFNVYNASQLAFARKYKYKKFIYAGGIVDETRDFCLERDGLEFWDYQGKEWNALEWRGKIPGVDFFIQCGGVNCRHHIEWIKE